jgi:hypothetical protein
MTTPPASNRAKPPLDGLVPAAASAVIVTAVIIAAVIIAGDDETRGRIEDQRPHVGRPVEIEHGEDRAGDTVERALAVRHRRRIDETQPPTPF